MNAQEQLITSFYEAFTRADAATMTAAYHKDILFEDPAFGQLRGENAGKMWRMLMKRSKGDIKVSFSNVKATETDGSASWIAEYEYGPKKRPVVNHVSAQFKFKDGKIIEHKDDFDMWKWSKQALGVPGYLLGWSALMKSKVQATTNELLQKFEA